MLLCAEAQSAKGDCLTTLPQNPAFSPPAPYSTRTDGFWYGSNDLWIRLPFSGHWRVAPKNDQKLFVWSQGYDWRTDPNPSLIVTGKRIDGEAPALAIAGGTNAIMGNTAAMLIGVNFPTEGCWELSVYHAGHVLTFVVSAGL
jgi:hypothetical protein